MFLIQQSDNDSQPHTYGIDVRMGLKQGDSHVRSKSVRQLRLHRRQFRAKLWQFRLEQLVYLLSVEAITPCLRPKEIRRRYVSRPSEFVAPDRYMLQELAALFQQRECYWVLLGKTPRDQS